MISETLCTFTDLPVLHTAAVVGMTTMNAVHVFAFLGSQVLTTHTLSVSNYLPSDWLEGLL